MKQDENEEFAVRFEIELESKPAGAAELRLIATHLPELLKDLLTETKEQGE